MGKYMFDGVKVNGEIEQAVERRMMDKKPDFRRFITDIPAIDNVLGGLPYGLTIFYGEAGTGKSMMAKVIASHHYSLYVCCESKLDFPAGNVKVMDYTKFLPMWDKALNELLVAIMRKEPEMVVIDSVTTFFSGTKKAVEEADVRSGVFELAKKTEGMIPIICTSEVRGSGYGTYEAGGRSVGHAASLLVRFGKVKVGHWESRRYGVNEGERLWTIDVEKDKQGIAQQGGEFTVKYAGDQEFPDVELSKVSYKETEEDR
jgi:predicted ATP-dependent serine protease